MNVGFDPRLTFDAATRASCLNENGGFVRHPPTLTSVVLVPVPAAPLIVGCRDRDRIYRGLGDIGQAASPVSEQRHQNIRTEWTSDQYGVGLIRFTQGFSD